MSNLACVDASLVVRLFGNAKDRAIVMPLWQSWWDAGDSLVAPSLLYYEVSNALHRYALQGVLRPQEAVAALNMALGLGITLYGDAELHRRALALAKRFALPAAYDAHYLALAERLGAEFWTADNRLLRAVQELSWVHGLQG